MGARQVVVLAGVACAVGWLTKMAIMLRQGGPEEGSTAESIAFLVGLAGFVILAAATGILLRPGRRAVSAVLTSVLAVLLAVLGLGMVQSALTLIPGDGWWQAELAFVVGALVALAVVLVARRRRGAPSGG